ncbi:uncharacterized protein LOC142984760 isoform X2 [Anticarsia gemmatalis]|uniref:uncharacterized protein LOC142984760 isoform X2 n=1 Tax=Anticarsia gemmatalis TaxID=129554 RepID=UPI003F76AA17
MCYKIVLLCYFTLVTAEKFDVENAHLSLNYIEESTDIGKVLFCTQNKTNLEEFKTTVLEGKDLFVEVFNSINKTVSIFIIECRHGGKVIFKETNKSDKKSIRNVTKDMAGDFECDIYLHKNKPVFKDPKKIGTDTYGFISCSFRIRVREIDSPQMVLVNNVVLPTNRKTLEERVIDHSAQYRYLLGDSVSVSCASIQLDQNICQSIEMYYEQVVPKDDALKTEPVTSNTGFINLRTKLKHGHDNSKMICICTTRNDKTTTQITFQLVTSFNNDINVAVNGVAIRFQSQSEHESTYKFETSAINIICSSNLQDVGVQKDGNCNALIDHFAIDDGKAFNTTLEINSECTFQCKLSNRAAEDSYNIIFQPAPKDFTVTSIMNMDLPENNTMMEIIYGTAMKLIYYEFEDGDEVPITCSYIKDKVGPILKMLIDGEKQSGGTYVFLNKNLTSQDDNTKLTYETKETVEPENEIFGRIVVVFRKKRPPVTTTVITTSTTLAYDEGLDQKTLMALAATGVALCIVLICVVITIYKMNKRKRQKAGPTPYENFRDATIPAHPPQWAGVEEPKYEVPIDQRNDIVIYSEPVGMPDTYAVPIPKNQRNKPSTEPTYADLEFTKKGPPSNYVNAQSQYATVGELNSQVVPKSARQGDHNAYGNVFPDSQYANSGPTEYVEPAYCVPHNLK